MRVGPKAKPGESSPPRRGSPLAPALFGAFAGGRFAAVAADADGGVGVHRLRALDVSRADELASQRSEGARTRRARRVGRVDMVHIARDGAPPPADARLAASTAVLQLPVDHPRLFSTPDEFGGTSARARRSVARAARSTPMSDAESRRHSPATSSRRPARDQRRAARARRSTCIARWSVAELREVRPPSSRWSSTVSSPKCTWRAISCCGRATRARALLHRARRVRVLVAEPNRPQSLRRVKTLRKEMYGFSAGRARHRARTSSPTRRSTSTRSTAPTSTTSGAPTPTSRSRCTSRWARRSTSSSR